MPLNINRQKTVFFYSCILISIIINACASIQQPTGGPKDSKAPKILKETPKNETKNFKSKTVVIEFDEYFKLNNEYAEISVSPAIENPPEFKIRQKSLQIEFKDTLEKNTTYVINFGKAIQDVNESNTLNNYSYVLATGDKIDSLSVSGTVVSSETKEAQKQVTVMLYKANQDTIFKKKRPSIFTLTDSSGNFKFKNLREDKYKIYALKEGESGGDRIYNSPDEEVAFLKNPINLNKDTSGIRLEVFKEKPSKLRLVDRKIENDGRILLAFNKTIKNPSIEISEPKALNTGKLVEFSANNDSAFVWLKELTFDSLLVSTKSGDTVINKTIIKRAKRDTYNRTLNFKTNLTGGKIKPGSSPVFTFNQPIQTIDQSKIKFLVDSVETDGLILTKQSGNSKKINVSFDWTIDEAYSISFEEGAIIDIYGTKNKKLTEDFALDKPENYGTLDLNITVEDTTKSYIVQLLNTKKDILKSDPVSKNVKLNYVNYPTGSYKIRVILDENKNGLYDTGSLDEQTQPEKIFYLDKEFTLRPNWDREEPVTIPKEFK